MWGRSTEPRDGQPWTPTTMAPGRRARGCAKTPMPALWLAPTIDAPGWRANPHGRQKRSELRESATPYPPPWLLAHSAVALKAPGGGGLPHHRRPEWDDGIRPLDMQSMPRPPVQGHSHLRLSPHRAVSSPQPAQMRSKHTPTLVRNYAVGELSPRVDQGLRSGCGRLIRQRNGERGAWPAAARNLASILPGAYAQYGP